VTDDVLSRLKTALADRYTIERELCSGGMARVYLAWDLKHERQAAVKVLRPELAAALGANRFLREMIAANLNHPHILPLHDSGKADGFLYYVMPYVARAIEQGEETRLTEPGIALGTPAYLSPAQASGDRGLCVILSDVGSEEISMASPMNDVVVVLPRITGSVLEQNGEPIWAHSGSAIVRGMLGLNTCASSGTSSGGTT
jgi:hypothetical protein